MPKKVKSKSAAKQKKKQKLLKQLHADDGQTFRTADEEPGVASDSDTEPQAQTAPREVRVKDKAHAVKPRALKQKKRRISDEESAPTQTQTQTQDEGAGKLRFVNKQKVLVFSSRGITYRHRHLMTDLRTLLPHSKKDVKLDSKDELTEVNDVCDEKNCNGCIFFEARKGKDLYMWLSKVPHGPSAKFHCVNIHTMEELKMAGNCIAGGRALLSFTEEFDSEPHWMVIKEILTHLFQTPLGHPKAKKYVDRVYNFAVDDGRVWFRNYQIVEPDDEQSKGRREAARAADGEDDSDPAGPLKDETTMMKESGLQLMEIGPRFTLEPIRIFNQSFRGSTLYENPDFISPNEIRREAKRASGMKTQGRETARLQRSVRKALLEVPQDELVDVFHE